MRDIVTSLFRASRTATRAALAMTLLAIACGAGGCASGGATSSFAMADSGSGATVAFESIDGPPPQVFDRMVSVLDSESKLRNLSIVSREGSASYRVRSYLAAEVSRGRTVIAWVWDVYDRNQQRALRLSGEEPAGKAGRDRLGCGRRSRAAENRASRIERAFRHGQRHRTGRRPACPGAWPARPGRGGSANRAHRRRAATASARWVPAAINEIVAATLFLRRKTCSDGLPAAPPP